MFLFVCLVNTFFGNVGKSFWVGPVLNNEDKVSCLRVQYHTYDGVRTLDFLVKSPVLSSTFRSKGLITFILPHLFYCCLYEKKNGKKKPRDEGFVFLVLRLSSSVGLSFHKP